MAVEPSSPSDFYTGLVADLYTPLKSTSFAPARYAALLAEHGEPGLELGCGDGDPLLDLVADGLDVDGIDSSADMIGRLHRRASERGLRLRAWVSRMEDLQVERPYRTVFLAGPTFNLLAHDDAMRAALRAIAAALAPDGTAVVPVFVPPPVPEGPGEPHRVETPTGWMGWQVLGTERDEVDRTQVTTLRYEREHDGDRERLDRAWLLHWVEPAMLRALAADAGLQVVSGPAQLGPDPADVVLRRAG